MNKEKEISMNTETPWQAQAVEQLSQRFKREPGARAFILSGSLSAAGDQADFWSDVDVKIIMADPAIDRYYLSTGWLAPLGRLIGAERQKNDLTKTLRVCLEGFQRFDLTFIAESALQEPSSWKENPLYPSYLVIWSKLADIQTRIASLPYPVPYQELSPEEIEELVDAFWFKASLAIRKVVRNDLLIGLHLALDLARDSLVLQMIRRDQKERTTIHRTGDWGNALASRFSWRNQNEASQEILSFVKSSCEIFDELASSLLPSYESRSSLLFPVIELAGRVCSERTKGGQ